MSDDEIEKAKEEAEKFAEEDKKRKDLVESKNKLEQLTYQMQNIIDENKDKLSDDAKDEVNKLIESAKEMKDKLSKISVTITAKAGSNDRLFGSVTNKDVAEALLSQHHIKIDKRRFDMEDIKNAGETTVSIKLYPDVTGELKVIVKAQ